MKMKKRKATRTTRKMNINRGLSQRALLSAFVFLLCSYSLLAVRDKDLHKNYGLIFGTAYGPDDRPFYGAKIEIHPAGKKRPSWEVNSDHRGEFAQRVPPCPADYEISAQAEVLPVVDGTAQKDKKKKLKAEAKIHIEKEERQDVSLHLKG